MLGHDALAQPQPLIDLIEIQPESVVSRGLLGGRSGSVTLFAFDAGQRLSEHSTPYDALVLGVEGRLEISIAGTPHRLAAGQLLRLPAGEPHAVHALEASKMLLIMLRDRSGD